MSTRMLLLKSISVSCLFLAMIPLRGQAADEAPTGKPLNILMITADDMNYDTLGVTGGKTPNITPNLDRLAGEGMLFVHAHVVVGVCQPSRECLMTGRYPHHNGAVGFYPILPDVPTLEESLKAAGYHLGILGKVTHLRPAEKFPWDFQHDQRELGMGRDPAIYYRYTKEFLAEAKQSGKPFFLMANSHDPHRPWAGSDAEQGMLWGRRRKKNGKNGSDVAAKAKKGAASARRSFPSPSRTYQPEEVAVPGFLPDLADVRKETAQYCSSARRCDQTVGEVLRALDEAGMKETTLVMFLSDNGISMPFAKSNCYLNSTHTPWIVRWPNHVTPGTVDTDDFISSIDYMPTILAAVGLPFPPGMDGRSFLPLLQGQTQQGRDHVVTCYNQTAGRRYYPMRCLQTKRFGYIYNGWSDGQMEYRAEPMAGLTFRAMQRAAVNDPGIAARVELLVHRVPEELYDFQADPDALHNLIADPAYRETAAQMRQRMEVWMRETKDPELDAYRQTIGTKP